MANVAAHWRTAGALTQRSFMQELIQNVTALLSTPKGWVITIVTLVAISIVIKVASLIVRVLALLVSLAMIALLIMRARGLAHF